MGPIVYVVESFDDDGAVLDLELPDDVPLESRYRSELLGGVTVVTTNALRGDQEVPMTAVPYFAWANRGAGEMAVWLRRAKSR